MKKLLCWIGIHDWKYTFSKPYKDYNYEEMVEETKQCRRCWSFVTTMKRVVKRVV